MVNRVALLGNLGADPEIRTMQSGDRVANLSIATSEKWKDKTTGEAREKTEWHKVVIFSQGLVGVAEKYLKKGSKVYIEGQLETRSWEKDGEKKYVTEIVLRGYNASLVMLDSKVSEPPQQAKEAVQPAPQQEFDDSIPFMRLMDDQF